MGSHCLHGDGSLWAAGTETSGFKDPSRQENSENTCQRRHMPGPFSESLRTKTGELGMTYVYCNPTSHSDLLL